MIPTATSYRAAAPRRPLGALRRLLALALAMLLVAGCDTDQEPVDSETEVRDAIVIPDAAGSLPLRAVSGLQQRLVGRGPSAAVLVWRDDEQTPPRDAVVFLHAWGGLTATPWSYRSWMAHLADQDLTVVFPIYQDAESTPAEVGENAIEGIVAALGEIDARGRTLIAAGHTTGAAIAIDYAAEAARRGLPIPRGVFAIYPARNPSDDTIPAADLSRVSADTRVEIISGLGNPVRDGERQARRLRRGIDHIPAERIRSRMAPEDQRGGPWKDDRRARRTFWQPLDQMIAAVRREADDGPAR